MKVEGEHWAAEGEKKAAWVFEAEGDSSAGLRSGAQEKRGPVCYRTAAAC